MNSGLLRIGDQVRQVNGRHLVRERLGVVVQQEFADAAEITLQISRPSDDPGEKTVAGEVFAVLELRRPDGALLAELSCDLWTIRADCVWGAFWTLLLPPATAAVYLCVHRSLLFTEPLLGCVELPLQELQLDALSTRWYPLRAKGKGPGQQPDIILGEVLLSIRRYRAAHSVSPAANVQYDSDDDEYYSPLTPRHGAEAIAPVEEPVCVYPVRAGG